MKYVVVLCDGMADRKLKELNGKTPMQVAYKPNMDNLAMLGEVGLCKTVPDGLKPASDIANLSVMGYNPQKYYSGRSPLEAVSMGVKLKDTDLTMRCNLVTLSGEKNYCDKTMIDYSSGEITTKESAELIKYLNENIKIDGLSLYSGISYRHLLVVDNKTPNNDLTPPHDITNKPVKDYLPKGELSELLLEFMEKSYELLSKHPINLKRVEMGLNPANSAWFWGEGTKPFLPSFKEKYGISGVVISGVDLIKGIGILAGMKSIDVVGATGNIDTNFDGKADAAINALLNDNYDFAYIHLEAPDECGHHGDIKGKIKSIELIDEKVVGKILNALENSGEEFSILICPDHPTPIEIMTHAKEPVPFLIYRSTSQISYGTQAFTEEEAEISNNFVEIGYALMDKFIKG